eukprot:TRINITY_DN156_c0_g1_i4.p2 TRINITY_DN156_c0_g1~~TRINITY_DN156_c0_g1_i4.p2  ORF type:complete len:195 (-),score=52.86 TRINITY_DN156_c0_g1_i4:1342-1926(-)
MLEKKKTLRKSAMVRKAKSKTTTTTTTTTMTTTAEELVLDTVYYSYDALPKFWKKKLEKSVSQRCCSHCHEKGNGTYKVMESKAGIVIKATAHKPLCTQDPSRICTKGAACEYTAGHTELKEQKKKEREEKQQKHKEKKHIEAKKKREVADVKRKEKDVASQEKAILKAKKAASRLRNGGGWVKLVYLEILQVF